MWASTAMPAPAPARKRHRGLFVAGVGALAVAATVVGLEVASSGGGTLAGLGTLTQPASGGTSNGGVFGGGSTGGGTFGGGSTGSGSSGSGSTGSGSGSTGSGSSGTQTSQGSASTAQQVGIVDIDTVLGYQSAEAAGTGMILTSSGEILTNNHVVEGATSIKVTVVASGKTYTATVVGTDATDDVAVIQLKNASGLKTANLGDSSSVKVGDNVTGVGNAGGVGGTPSAASGTVQQLNQTITATDDSGANSETLKGLIETNAPIQAGDSGGPLYSSAGKIIGMDTAAETASSGGQGSFGNSSSQNEVAALAYAIPIDNALSIAKQIVSGVSSSTIVQGYPSFLGVEVSATATTTTAGAAVSAVLPNTPADNVGITGGDVITSVGGSQIATSDSLKTALNKYKPGQSVKIGWTDENGQSHTATVTLIQGPAA